MGDPEQDRDQHQGTQCGPTHIAQQTRAKLADKRRIARQTQRDLIAECAALASALDQLADLPGPAAQAHKTRVLERGLDKQDA